MFFRRHETPGAYLARIDDRGFLSERIFLELRQATIDHIVQQSLDGSHEEENLRVICLLCNNAREGSYPFGVNTWEDHE
jgi:5-methylcytosine-specific restriction endonuclease McrA